MKFNTLVVAAAVCGIHQVSAFAKSTAAIFVRPDTALEATIAPVKKLVPPSDVPPGESASAFETYVQKTYGRYPLTITKGKGCTLTDEDGKIYLDFVAGIATCVLGHGHPLLTEAIEKQMAELHHVSNLYYIPQQAALAKWLVENSCAEKVFFCNSGAESNEGAIKLARRHASNRGITDPVIITAHDSFHGRTLAAITATGQEKYHKGFGYGGEMVQGFTYVKYNDVNELVEKVKEINDTPAELAAEGRKRGVAAIMLEPLQGEGGILPGTSEYFEKARELCDESGSLLICDEVQAGMGRTGTLWGHENLGIVPDVFTSAKALGGGVPIGALLARGEAADVFGPGDHASTYGGNPLACAAGLAVAKAFCHENLLENCNERGAQLKKGLKAISAKYPNVLGEVRGWGLMLGIDSVSCPAGELVGDCMKDGLLLVPAGPKTVRFVPPLVVSEAEVEQALKIFEETVSKKACT